MLLDSNLIIYASKPEYDNLRSLGDATIAATALVNNLPIATHNVSDFRWIPNLVFSGH